MGREIRMVIPDWEHPREDVFKYIPEPRMVKSFIPMHDETVDHAFHEWFEEFIEHRELTYGEFCEYHGTPPDPKYYRPEWDEEPSWYQVYETVSEGTPVTPPFSTRTELIDYLVANGDFWDQSRRKRYPMDSGNEPWSVEAATNFVRNTEWAPSGFAIDGQYHRGHEVV